MSIKHKLNAVDDEAATRPRTRPWRATLALAAGGMVAFALIATSGCGPLGLYSLAHSLLNGHHVFKPVLPDEPMREGDEWAEHGNGLPAGAAAGENSRRSTEGASFDSPG